MRTERSHLRAIVNQDGAAILNSDEGTITTLNSTGAFVWQALDRGEAPDLIVQNLARETDGKADALEHDVREFIQVLKDRQLLAH
jgi:hypothetical protein